MFFGLEVHLSVQRIGARRASRECTYAVHVQLDHLEELTGGYDFATVVTRYWEGFETGDEEIKSSALRWLRAEYSTRTDARKALGVRTIIDDANVYDQLKLLAGCTSDFWDCEK